MLILAVFVNGGANDVKNHLTTSKHQEVVRASSSSDKLKRNVFTICYSRQNYTSKNVVCQFYITKHIIHLMTAMFPESKIAKVSRVYRTKATCIVIGTLPPQFHQPVIYFCQKGPFSILRNEGNDVEDKTFAILVHL